MIAPFPADFFGSPYSGSWTFPVTLPDVRIASAEMFVTNRKGNSATRAIHLTTQRRSADCGRFRAGSIRIQVGRLPGGGRIGGAAAGG